MPTAIEIDVLAPSFIEIPEDRLHAIACRLAEEFQSEHRAQEKPWTVWPFRRAEGQRVPEGSVGLTLRVNWLIDGPLPKLLGHRTPDALQLGKYRCRVVGRRYELVPFEWLVGTPPAESARIEFHRPTYFSRGGDSVPRPEPALILGSLIRKWNLSAPSEHRIPERRVNALKCGVKLTDVAVELEQVSVGGGGRRTAFSGSVELHIADPRANSGTFAALMRSAEFFGIGAGTTRGLGVATAQLR